MSTAGHAPFLLLLIALSTAGFSLNCEVQYCGYPVDVAGYQFQINWKATGLLGEVGSEDAFPLVLICAILPSTALVLRWLHICDLWFYGGRHRLLLASSASRVAFLTGYCFP